MGENYNILEPVNEEDNRDIGKYAQSLNSSHLKTEDSNDLSGGRRKWINVYRKHLVLYSIIIIMAILLVIVLFLLYSGTTTPSTITPKDCVPQGDRHFLSEMRIFNNVSYELVRIPRRNWTDAVDACTRYCSVLTSIESLEEFLFLKEFIDEENSAWIGGTILNRTKFEWIENGKPVPPFIWNVGEPNNQDYEQCIDLYSRRVTGANDNRCDEELPFICKFKSIVRS